VKEAEPHKIADDARGLAEERQAQLYVVNGLRLTDQADWLGALPWFAEALRMSQGDPQRERPHRLRLAAMLKHCTRLLSQWQLDKDAEQTLSPDGRFALVFQGAGDERQTQLWDTWQGQSVGGPWPALPPL
jgi:hypothetical protein